MEPGDDLDFGVSKARSAKKGRRAKADDENPEADRQKTAFFDEDDLEIDIATVNSSAKKGRRAGGGRRDRDGDDEPEALRDDDAPPKPSKRMGGWGEDTKSAGRRRTGMEELEDDRLRPRSPSASEDSDNDIPVIPDLEEYQEDDLTTQIAQAPNIAVNRVATYRELDNDLLRHAAFLTLDNEIDLKALSKYLSAEAEVVEEDVAWDWDRLFTEVTSELTTEWEKSQQVEQET
ncbi:intraflagellar transport protein 43 homolog A-like [Tubulanus polymorphus]|uniref:intraflagellar transport protein 43 homolog A-like n=1 Tax=Tubulanus polymorphus TaxID=672921 RepID=UPI003DA59047